MAQRMDEISALQLVMDDDCDWNDSEDEEVTDVDNRVIDEPYEPLDAVQMGKSDDEPETSNHEECCTSMDQSISDESSSIGDLEFSEPVGPAEPYLPSDATPLDFFMLMVGQDFFEYLATETNRYAAQKPPLPSYKWEDTNADEVMLFIGMIFAMGINVQPKLQDY